MLNVDTMVNTVIIQIIRIDNTIWWSYDHLLLLFYIDDSAIDSTDITICENSNVYFWLITIPFKTGS